MGRPRALLRSLLVALLAAGILAVGGSAEAAGCGVGALPGSLLRGAEGELASLGNAARTAAGAAPLAVDGELASLARAHAERMAASGGIFHNDGYFGLLDDLGAAMLAENVGMGCSALKIHEAFLASPGHRANLLNARLTHAGFGAATDASGVLYVVQAFATYASPPPPPTPVAVVTAPDPTPRVTPPTPDPTARPTPVSTSSPHPTATPDPTPTVDPDRTVSAAGRPGTPVAEAAPVAARQPDGRGLALAAAAVAGALALLAAGVARLRRA